MSANLDPIFTNIPILGFTRCSSNNVAADGTGTINTIVTGSTNGTKVDIITFSSSQAVRTTANSAMVGRMFVSDASLNFKLYNEVLIPTTGVSDSSLGARAQIYTGGLVITNGTQ